MPTPPNTALVVGGGLAGISAAVALASAGTRVTLLEARHSLGGRATSFTDPHSGEELDNCQHVLLGCCTNLLDLYARLGVQDRVLFQNAVCFLDARGKRHTLSGNAMFPAPLHLGASMARFGLLSLKERAAVARAMTAMVRLGRAGRNQLESLSFGDWARQHAQPETLFQKFYDPVLISALNEHAHLAAAKYAIMVFQDAMLAHRRGHLVGLPTCPLGQLYSKLPAGVELRLNTRVEQLLFGAPDAAPTEAARSAPPIRAIQLRSGEVLSADAVVLATNHHAVQRWIPAELAARDARFAHLGQLTSVPILGVHLWFDRPVIDVPALALTSGPLHWLFKKDAAGRAVHGVISAAREWDRVPKEAALKQFEAQVRALIPAARDAALVRGVIVIEKRATFAPLPDTEKFRPQQAPPPGGIANLHLAGDYTRTDWPATMEGAVRSGYLAAAAITGRRHVVDDLPVEWPARILGL